MLSLKSTGSQRDAMNRKTTLLFTIRDHDEHDSPLHVISKQLTNDMERIWSDLTLPEGLEDLTCFDLFDVKFCGLAHKRYQPVEFENGVDNLRRR